MKYEPTWGSHIPVLIKVMEHTSGCVLELGMGISSTPLLHMLCFDKDRHLVSYEDDPTFIKMFEKYADSTHEIRKVEDWNHINLDHDWSVVLVDHKPAERRIEEIKRLNAEYIVIHDSEPSMNELYRYDEIYPLFKHRFDYTKALVHTTVLSNNNLEWLK